MFINVWSDTNSKTKEKFEKHEIEEIKKFIPKLGYGRYGSHLSGNYMDIEYNHMSIWKIMDEWFYIYVNDRGSISFYKCDQLSGLIDFLSDYSSNDTSPYEEV